MFSSFVYSKLMLSSDDWLSQNLPTHSTHYFLSCILLQRCANAAARTRTMSGSSSAGFFLSPPPTAVAVTICATTTTTAAYSYSSSSAGAVCVDCAGEQVVKSSSTEPQR